ncbi:chondroitin sulfate proteoglycan 5 [Rhea pennata]|uniref:chondroitin sulfate proteoglycan 5 n=1 Tax=Rhea pennata TaxID=8795 RepID=UPI002E252CBB
MAPAARRPRAALALLLALAALGPAAPASAWAPRNASEGWAATPASSSLQRARGAADAPEPADNGTRPRGPPAASAAPAGSRLDPAGAATAAPGPPEAPEPAVGVVPGAGKAAPPVPAGPSGGSGGAEAAPCFGCAGEEPGSGEPPPPGPAGPRAALEGLTAAPPPPPAAGPPRDRAVPAPGATAPGTAEPPAGRTVAEILDVDYYELLAGGEGAAGGAATPWGLRELYDDFTPFDEADFYPTTSFYADGDEEGEEGEEDEEDEEAEAGGLEDENGLRAPTAAGPGVPTAGPEPRPTGRRAAAPLPPAVAAPGPGNGTGCRSGYARHNGSCRSLCDLVPGYCHNGGQCYLVESHGAFCRCNTQAYTWHKGPRCEAVVTDFQVLCVAVGSAALALLLLLMLAVCFAKRLYLLKAENRRLRRSKYRGPAELHNDNFSLSTIAEGSHPTDGAKPPEPPPPGGKEAGDDDEEEEDGAFGAPGAPASPQRPGGKGERDGAGANCLPNSAA